jgi:hypothetical protein
MAWTRLNDIPQTTAQQKIRLQWKPIDFPADGD